MRWTSFVRKKNEVNLEQKSGSIKKGHPHDQEKKEGNFD